MKRVSIDVMKVEIKKAFVKAGMSEEKADICAQIHTESSRDGVYSHGLNRVARFVDCIKKGLVDVNAEPVLVKQSGVIENYDGNCGPGILNGKFAMNRAMEIAKENGIGLVSLKDTTHWMRGGSYGWQAADNGYIGICWTNTESCMPAWGGKNVSVGNNPFIMAIPREKGNIVLDMAMSQFSYGKLQATKFKNEMLPFPGGFDDHGNLTSDPGLIEESMRILPMGYWKGSGFAIVLDLIAAIISGGLATSGIDKKQEGGGSKYCQIFVAINPNLAGGKDFVESTLNETVEQIKATEPSIDGEEIFYPGEIAMKLRNENLKKGIPVDERVWQEVLNL